jgi:hypothetical protein
MTDDELIERLRRTLQTEAAAIKPGPAGEPAASYPTNGPVPRLRARWPLALAAAGVAAAVGLLAAYWPVGGGSSRLGIVSPSASTTTAPASTVPATTAPVVAPTTVAPAVGATTPLVPATSQSPTTVPASREVPAGFAPQSVTFVSAEEGWVAGAVPCSSGSCLALARTSDAGQSWQSAVAPPVKVTTGVYPGGDVVVRFANADDGWIYSRQPVALWSTHDGGATWHQAGVPGLTAGATIMGMEAGAGRVQVAIIPASGTTIHLATSPVASDSWAVIDTGVAVGAGPVPAAQLVLQKSQGWLLENDRTVIGGVRLNSAGAWTAWTPPCRTANGTAALAASTPTDLVAICQEGQWGPARNLPSGAQVPSIWLFRSSDGGASFQTVGPIRGTTGMAGVASPAPSTVVFGGGEAQSADLLATFDAGHTWLAVYQNPQVQTWSFVGFTTLSQGVAIGSGANGPAVMAMTRDGGHTWTAVSF